MTTYVFSFGNGTADGDGKMKDTLGGKGAGLAEMCRAKLPVPPGFTVSTQVCNLYFHNKNAVPAEIHQQMLDALKLLEQRMGQKLGDVENPLLVSVRSGAKFSMPGMMDTVLNLGLNDESVKGLAQQTNDDRFANDSYRRFISMYGRIVLGIEGAAFDEPFDKAKDRAGVTSDAELPASALADLAEEYKAVVEAATGRPFPQD